MSSDEDTTMGRTAPNPPVTRRQGIGSTAATINDLAGGMSNTNVDGTVEPSFFAARLQNEATTLALYGYLLSESCVLGLQGRVQLPEGVNCALDFLELFRRSRGQSTQTPASF